MTSDLMVRCLAGWRICRGGFCALRLPCRNYSGGTFSGPMSPGRSSSPQRVRLATTRLATTERQGRSRWNIFCLKHGQIVSDMRMSLTEHQERRRSRIFGPARGHTSCDLRMCKHQGGPRSKTFGQVRGHTVSDLRMRLVQHQGGSVLRRTQSTFCVTSSSREPTDAQVGQVLLCVLSAMVRGRAGPSPRPRST